uniref:Aldehyde dehydrogenase domain-containing protein n=1 Tax=Setaria italica TaxID=4555 RepID=K4AMD2_SETIT
MATNDCNSSGNAADLVVPEIKFTKLFINGEFVDPVSGDTFETRDPRTGNVLAHIAEADKADADLAVKAAREAFDHGTKNGSRSRIPTSYCTTCVLLLHENLHCNSRNTIEERGRTMNRLADLVEQHTEELAALDGADAGKLLLLGKLMDIPFAAQTLRYYAGAADKYQGYTLKEPIGVVGIIIPWNFPSLMFFLKVSPALAAGCTVVVKPAEQTPLSALYYAHLAKLAGIPDGVINAVPGFGPTAGAAITSHMNVDSVSFTGSGEVGRLVMESAARSNLKTVSLELGGKSPLIIFDDADVDMAVNLSRLAIFYNKGEVCVAGSRVYVQEGIYDEFVKKAVEAAQNWKVDKEQFEVVLSYIQHGKSEGATLLTGGKPAGDKGYYIEPTIFADVTEDMKIAQEEIFGPVMSLMKFKTVDEAIEKANCTKYGLAAGIVTRSLDVANRVSRSVRAGT